MLLNFSIEWRNRFDGCQTCSLLFRTSDNLLNIYACDIFFVMQSTFEFLTKRFRKKKCK